MHNVIFEHENNTYKLILDVSETFNDYRQNVYVAQLKLYTTDNMLIESDNYLFPVKVERYSNVVMGFDFFLDHLQSRFLPSTLAYDMYLKALRDGSEIAKKL